MAIRTMHASTYFFLLAAVVCAQSSPHSASQVVYLKLLSLPTVVSCIWCKRYSS